MITNLITSTVSVTDAQSLLDHASRQSDRWLFLACLLLLFGVLIWDKSDSKKVIKAMFEEMRSDRKESDKVIDKNTEAMIRVEDALNRRS